MALDPGSGKNIANPQHCLYGGNKPNEPDQVPDPLYKADGRELNDSFPHTVSIKLASAEKLPVSLFLLFIFFFVSFYCTLWFRFEFNCQLRKTDILFMRRSIKASQPRRLRVGFYVSEKGNVLYAPPRREGGWTYIQGLYNTTDG